VFTGGALALFTSIVFATILGSCERKIPKWLAALLTGLVYFGFGMYSMITVFMGQHKADGKVQHWLSPKD